MHELRRDCYPYLTFPITASQTSSFLSRSFQVRQWGKTIHLADRQDNPNAFLRVEYITTLDIECYLATNSGAIINQIRPGETKSVANTGTGVGETHAQERSLV